MIFQKIKDKITILKLDIDRYGDQYIKCGCKEKWDFSHTKWAYLKNFYLLFFFRNHCFRVILYYRIPLLKKLIGWFFKPEFDSTLIFASNVEGGGIVFSHAFATVINCDHIGYGCTFLQGVTIGNKPKNGKYVRPYLESNVYVGANATIIGDVHIGNNVKIGAGAVVTKSIPDNCVVVGNPARIIMKDGVRTNIIL